MSENEKELFEAVEKLINFVFREEEKQLRNRLRIIWRNPIGIMIAKKFVSIARRGNFDIIEKDGKGYLTWDFDIVCEPEILSVVFLRRDKNES